MISNDWASRFQVPLDATSWHGLGRRICEALDAAIPDALLNVVAEDERNGSGTISGITRPVVQRNVEALGDDDILELVNEWPEILMHVGGHSDYEWARRRDPQPRTAKSNPPVVIIDRLRAATETLMREYVDLYLAERHG